jgi:hypothetical protein
MPPSRIWVEPIVTVSPSRIFGTPVISAASASDGSMRSRTAVAEDRIMQKAKLVSIEECSDCGMDSAMGLAAGWSHAPST